MTAGLKLSLTALKLIVIGVTLYLRRSVRVLSDVQYLFTECRGVAALSAKQDATIFAGCGSQKPSG